MYRNFKVDCKPFCLKSMLNLKKKKLSPDKNESKDKKTNIPI